MDIISEIKTDNMRYWKTLAIVVGFLILSFLFWRGTNEKIQNLDISKVIDFNQIEFAGKKTPFDTNHYFNKEKLTKELNITRFNVYQFVLYHKREPIYFPIIERKLKEAGIPDDFKYLAVAESGLKNDALSDSNAGGIWQFIPDTGRRYGLEIDNDIDERYNFEKETDAAIRYFKKMYEDFHDWTLVAAAFNRGENGIRRALDDQKVNSYYDLYLNDETSRYVFRIIAIKYLMLNRYKIFDSGELGDRFESPKTKTISVGKIDNLKDWSNKNKYIYANIKQLNPWIIADALPDGKWDLKVFDY